MCYWFLFYKSATWTELQVPLPALTICSDTKFDSHFLINAFKQIRNDLSHGLNSTDLNQSEKRNIMAFLCPLFQKNNTIPFANHSNDYFNDFVDELSVRDALEHCNTRYWSSLENYHCDQTVQKVITESGLCYTFNHLPCSEIYKENVWVYRYQIWHKKHVIGIIWEIKLSSI